MRRRRLDVGRVVDFDLSAFPLRRAHEVATGWLEEHGRSCVIEIVVRELEIEHGRLRAFDRRQVSGELHEMLRKAGAFVGRCLERWRDAAAVDRPMRFRVARRDVDVARGVRGDAAPAPHAAAAEMSAVFPGGEEAPGHRERARIDGDHLAAPGRGLAIRTRSEIELAVRERHRGVRERRLAGQ